MEAPVGTFPPGLERKLKDEIEGEVAIGDFLSAFL